MPRGNRMILEACLLYSAEYRAPGQSLLYCVEKPFGDRILEGFFLWVRR
jgi:hypothetical protein